MLYIYKKYLYFLFILLFVLKKIRNVFIKNLILKEFFFIDLFKFYYNEIGIEGFFLFYRNRIWNMFCDDFFCFVEVVVVCR